MADYLRDIDLKDFLIQSCDVDSGIDSQPLDEWTVLQGARNRAINALESGEAEGVGVGLEGGLTVVPGDDRYYLVCTAVIRDRLGVDFIGISSKLVLPRSVSNAIKEGNEFGVVIRKEASTVSDVNGYYQELISRNLSFKQAIHNAFLNYFNHR